MQRVVKTRCNSRPQMFCKLWWQVPATTRNIPKAAFILDSFRHALFNGFLRLSDRSCWLLLIGQAAFSAWHMTRKYASRITVEDQSQNGSDHKSPKKITGITVDKGSASLVHFRGHLDWPYPGCYAYTIQHFDRRIAKACEEGAGRAVLSPSDLQQCSWYSPWFGL